MAVAVTLTSVACGGSVSGAAAPAAIPAQTGDLVAAHGPAGQGTVFRFITDKGSVGFTIVGDWPTVSMQSRLPIAVAAFQIPNAADKGTSDSTNVAVSVIDLDSEQGRADRARFGRQYGASPPHSENYEGWVIYRQQAAQRATEYVLLDAVRDAPDLRAAVAVRLAWPHLRRNAAGYDDQMDALFRSLLTSVSIKQGPYLPVAGDVVRRPATGAAAGGAVGAASQPLRVIHPKPGSGPLIVSCDKLPAKAVRTVPSPLDQYVTLACTRSGQALRPVDGYSWVFDRGAVMWPSATNPSSPSKDDYYKALAVKPLSSDEVASLRAELAKLHPETAVLRRPILRFSVSTSWGEEKEIYLLPPQDGAPKGTRTLGMECIHHCRPIETDPQFFVVVPDGEGH